MHFVYVAVAVAAGVLLTGCSPWEHDYSSAQMTSWLFPVGTGSAKPSAHAAVYAGNADDAAGNYNALALRRSAWHAAKIRGDEPSGDTTGFCEAVANADASSASYDPATSQRIEAMRQAQCHALMTP